MRKAIQSKITDENLGKLVNLIDRLSKPMAIVGIVLAIVAIIVPAFVRIWG